MGVEIQNIQKNFYQGETKIEVLKNVSAKVSKGEVVAIVGESGSGKSTMLSLLSGLDRADSGAIIIDGTDMTKLSEKEMTGFRAANISIVFQQYHLLSHLTALENVMLPAEILGQKNIKEDALKLLEDMNLSHRINHFPSQLSGGESQRVAIARALITRPHLLLADEPSGNLDTKTGDSVMNSFFEIIKKHNITTMLVTHSEILAAKCERTLKLSNGVLI